MLTSHVADGRLAVNHSQCSLVSEKDEQNYTRLTVEAGLKSDSARNHVGHADLVHVPRLGRERTSRHRLAEIRHVDVVLACSHEIIGGSDVTSKERETETETDRETESVVVDNSITGISQTHNRTTPAINKLCVKVSS